MIKTRHLKNIFQGFLMALTWLVLFQGEARAQITDLGIFGGTSYYMGDLNTSRQFVNRELAGGVIIRHSFNSHVSVKGGLSMAHIRGNDADSPYDISPPDPYSFKTQIIELHLQGEINFLPFETGDADTPYTPYIFGGLAGFLFDPDAINPEPIDGRFSHALLFGVGWKYNIVSNLSGGLEWGMRRTNTDLLDAVSLRGNPKNNDWYSFAGLHLTYKFRDRSRASCPYLPY